MTTYLVKYNGNSTRFRAFERKINADCEREAVESVYRQYLDHSYFPQADGSIKDCDGHTVAEEDGDIIEHDGGYFYAELIDEG